MHVAVLAFKILDHCSHENIDIHSKVSPGQNFFAKYFNFRSMVFHSKVLLLLGKRTYNPYNKISKYLETNRQN